ncbi:MAG: dipeptidyl-peptidase 3 family protein [Flammeovirgaceae bacterium]
MKKLLLWSLVGLFALAACQQKQPEEGNNTTTKRTVPAIASQVADEKGVYTEYELKTDLSQLTEAEKKMIPILMEAANIMDELFWMESYGDKDELMAKLTNEGDKKYTLLNYGPWDRLGGDSSFIEGIGEKPKGAQFYPEDMTQDEFEALPQAERESLYTLIQRDSDGNLKIVPYKEAFKEQVTKASNLLKEAAAIAEEADLKKYLNLRAEALLTDDYMESDRAWMDMKDNGIDVIIGPIETYEDALYGYKAAHEAYILVKDKAWSKRLAKYAAMLPGLQAGLPVDAKYKPELGGNTSQLNAYDVIYYTGHCNAGSKTIAVNLPNDETIQEEKGSRRSQLKNAMRAKFDKILLPISEVLIDPEQRKNITFDAFFANTMFHEVAHGLGIKNTVDGSSTVRKALKNHASALEEGKADILGLYMVTELFNQGEITDGTIEDYYTTFMASIFRSVRFGAASAHGKANMIRFNYFLEKGAFERDAETGTYKVNIDKMKEAMTSLSTLILTIQGDGDYDRLDKLVQEQGVIGETLQADLDRLAELGIPTDIAFKQGLEVLGL